MGMVIHNPRALHVSSPKDDQSLMVPSIFVVMHVNRENHDTVTLTLAPMPGSSLPTIAPGQFSMLYAFGVGEVPISFCSIDKDQASLHHTIRAVGKVSKRLCKMEVGDKVGVRGPFGQGWPMNKVEGKQLILVAGGIGLAPLRPVLEALSTVNQSFKSCLLFYGARSPADRIFISDLEAWSKSSGLSIYDTVDIAPLDWSGRVGVVTTLIDAIKPNTEAVAFLCGPEIMMNFSIQILLEKKLSPDNIFLSMERNMKCAEGHCGHCMFGPDFICKDGPVFSYAHLASRFRISEL